MRSSRSPTSTQPNSTTSFTVCRLRPPCDCCVCSGLCVDKKTILQDLAYALRDPDATVRGNADKSRCRNRNLCRKNPAPICGFKHPWFIELLNSPVFTDRNNAAIALVTLTESRPAGNPGPASKRSAAFVSSRWLAGTSRRMRCRLIILLGRTAGNSRERRASRLVERDNGNGLLSRRPSIQKRNKRRRIVRRLWRRRRNRLACCHSSGVFACPRHYLQSGLVSSIHLFFRSPVCITAIRSARPPPSRSLQSLLGSLRRVPTIGFSGPSFFIACRVRKSNDCTMTRRSIPCRLIASWNNRTNASGDGARPRAGSRKSSSRY